MEYKVPGVSRRLRARFFISFVLIAIANAVILPPAARASDTPEAATLFGKRCTACHTYGKGIRVGPDLKGATDRRARAWLVRFIRSSQTVIQAGDPTAVSLFRQFKEQRMPDWSDLTPAQVEGILDYFAAGGPEKKTPDERNADTATRADIDLGRRLFHGDVSFAGGGEACSSCHSVRDSNAPRGGTLGPDLTTAYVRYQDKALTSFLKHPCTARDPEMTAGDFLRPEESFAIKTYLRQASLMQPAAMNSAQVSAGAVHKSSMLVSPRPQP